MTSTGSCSQRPADDDDDMEESQKDFEALSHALLPDDRHQVVGSENIHLDDKTTCSGFYANCDTSKSESALMPGPLDHQEAMVVGSDFPIFEPVITVQDTCQSISVDNDQSNEYSNLPLHDGNCVNLEDIPLEVNAVLVDLPRDVIGAPPPPYTLVRGRRMRFLPQRMHFPSDSSHGNFRHHNNADFYRLHNNQQYLQHHQQDVAKNCCSSLMISGNLNIRWFIIIISFIALCCVVVGIVLGALKGANEFTGDDSLTIALLLIGK